MKEADSLNLSEHSFQRADKNYDNSIAYDLSCVKKSKLFGMDVRLTQCLRATIYISDSIEKANKFKWLKK